MDTKKVIDRLLEREGIAWSSEVPYSEEQLLQSIQQRVAALAMVYKTLKKYHPFPQCIRSVQDAYYGCLTIEGLIADALGVPATGEEIDQKAQRVASLDAEADIKNILSRYTLAKLHEFGSRLDRHLPDFIAETNVVGVLKLVIGWVHKAMDAFERQQ